VLNANVNKWAWCIEVCESLQNKRWGHARFFGVAIFPDEALTIKKKRDFNELFIILKD